MVRRETRATRAAPVAAPTVAAVAGGPWDGAANADPAARSRVALDGGEGDVADAGQATPDATGGGLVGAIRTATNEAIDVAMAANTTPQANAGGGLAAVASASLIAPLALAAPPIGATPAIGVDVGGAAGARPPVAGVALIGYAPIVRVDAERREIELCATSEAIDSHGTVFDYAASKAAFLRWLGNVREMHERRAVGTRVAVRCDDEARKIFVRLRISRGAQDTWEKVLDGTLRGASIGATGVVWRQQRRRVAGQERTLDVATRYDLAELSLVDNPSNPDALGVTFVRDATPDLALLDALTPLDTLTLAPQGSAEDAMVARTVAPEDAAARAQGLYCANPVGYPDMGDPAQAKARPTAALGLPGRASPLADGAANASERFHAATRALLVGCGCLLCQAAQAALGGAEDADGRREATRDLPTSEARLREAALTRVVTAGLHASADRLAGMEVALREVAGATEGIAQRLAAALDATTETLGALGGRVATLEAQPLVGGPAARPVEKTHALAGRSVAGSSAGLGSASALGWSGGGQINEEEQYRALESLGGRLRDPQAQIAVAAELIRLRQG